MTLSRLLQQLLKYFWFLPGFLLWAAFPPMGERMDVLFALAPLMWLSRREPDAARVARRWLMSGLFYWLATLSWMPAISKNGGPMPLVLLGLFALAGYCAMFFAAYGYLSAKAWAWARNGSYGRRLATVLVFEPVLWCGLEIVRSRFLGGFSWNQLGVVPVNSGFAAPAALGGVYLCSAVVVLVNGTIAGIVERVWKPERSGFVNLKRLGSLETMLAFGLVWGLFALGSWLTAPAEPASAESEASLKVAMIQRNFPCVFKAQEENPYQVYDRLLDNVAGLLPDLVVLSESALCEFGPVDQQGAINFANWLNRRCGASLLAGGTRYEDGLTYNSAALYSFSPTPLAQVAGAPVVQTYDKVHLVPFGEFIPGDKLMPALQKLAPVGSCTPGEPRLLDVPSARSGDAVRAGVAICFEDTDSALVRGFAAKGAQLLFFITNDSWFSYSIEAEQHAWQAVARAVETGLPVVRVGNSGVTGTITPDGRTSWLIGDDGRALVDRQGTMFDRVVVKKSPRKTPYVVLGDWPMGIAFALLILSMILVKYRHHYEN